MVMGISQSGHSTVPSFYVFFFFLFKLP